MLSNCTSKVWFKVVFLFQAYCKNGCGDSLQTSNLAFIMSFSGVFQLKSSKVGLLGSQEMSISSFEK